MILRTPADHRDISMTRASVDEARYKNPGKLRAQKTLNRSATDERRKFDTTTGMQTHPSTVSLSQNSLVARVFKMSNVACVAGTDI